MKTREPNSEVRYFFAHTDFGTYRSITKKLSNSDLNINCTLIPATYQKEHSSIGTKPFDLDIVGFIKTIFGFSEFFQTSSRKIPLDKIDHPLVMIMANEHKPNLCAILIKTGTKGALHYFGFTTDIYSCQYFSSPFYSPKENKAEQGHKMEVWQTCQYIENFLKLGERAKMESSESMSAKKKDKIPPRHRAFFNQDMMRDKISRAYEELKSHSRTGNSQHSSKSSSRISSYQEAEEFPAIDNPESFHSSRNGSRIGSMEQYSEKPEISQYSSLRSFSPSSYGGAAQSSTANPFIKNPSNNRLTTISALSSAAAKLTTQNYAYFEKDGTKIEARDIDRLVYTPTYDFHFQENEEEKMVHNENHVIATLFHIENICIAKKTTADHLPDIDEKIAYGMAQITQTKLSKSRLSLLDGLPESHFDEQESNQLGQKIWQIEIQKDQKGDFTNQLSCAAKTLNRADSSNQEMVKSDDLQHSQKATLEELPEDDQESKRYAQLTQSEQKPPEDNFGINIGIKNSDQILAEAKQKNDNGLTYCIQIEIQKAVAIFEKILLLTNIKNYHQESRIFYEKMANKHQDGRKYNQESYDEYKKDPDFKENWLLDLEFLYKAAKYEILGVKFNEFDPRNALYWLTKQDMRYHKEIEGLEKNLADLLELYPSLQTIFSRESLELILEKLPESRCDDSETPHFQSSAMKPTKTYQEPESTENSEKMVVEGENRKQDIYIGESYKSALEEINKLKQKAFLSKEISAQITEKLISGLKSDKEIEIVVYNIENGSMEKIDEAYKSQLKDLDSLDESERLKFITNFLTRDTEFDEKNLPKYALSYLKKNISKLEEKDLVKIFTNAVKRKLSRQVGFLLDALDLKKNEEFEEKEGYEAKLYRLLYDDDQHLEEIADIIIANYDLTTAEIILEKYRELDLGEDFLHHGESGQMSFIVKIYELFVTNKSEEVVDFFRRFEDIFCLASALLLEEKFVDVNIEDESDFNDENGSKKLEKADIATNDRERFNSLSNQLLKSDLFEIVDICGTKKIEQSETAANKEELKILIEHIRSRKLDPNDVKLTAKLEIIRAASELGLIKSSLTAKAEPKTILEGITKRRFSESEETTLESKRLKSIGSSSGNVRSRST